MGGGPTPVPGNRSRALAVDSFICRKNEANDALGSLFRLHPSVSRRPPELHLQASRPP